MPNTYTVKSGDNLSTIAKNYGVGVGDITGYKSGNPNLIYPGEVLNIGGNQPAASSSNAYAGVPQSTQSLPPQFTTPNLDFVNKQIADIKSTDATKAAASASAVKALQDYYAGLPSATDLFSSINTQQGVPDQQNLVNDITKNVMTTEDALAAVTPGVNTRSSDFLVNDAQRQAIINRESQPLNDTLTKLLRSKQYEEVGLAGKQQLVSQLLSLSLTDQTNKAKPFELGVDFTEKDRAAADDLLKTLLSSTSSAYAADTQAYNDKIKAATDFNNSLTLENVKSANAIKEKAAPSGSGGGGTGGGTLNKNTSGALNTISSLVQKADSKQGAKSSVWQYIHSVIEPTAKAQGIDTGPLWAIYNQL